MMSPPDQLVIQQMTQWIRSFVIKFNLCPFAKREMDKCSVRMKVSPAQAFQHALAELKIELELLDENPDLATTFLIFPAFMHDFFDYLDFVEKANSSLCVAGYEGIYQLATFHPDYCFADAPVEDVTNYTNRSPYPMLHILREDDLERAIAAYGNTDKIPENNMARLRELGLEKVKELFQECK